MVALSRILTIHTNSRLDSLRAARKRVRDAVVGAGASAGVASEIELAVGEAFSNIYRHAYNGAAGPVKIQLDQTGAHVTVSVADEGQTVIPPVVPRTAPAATSDGGRGLYLMRHLVDDLALSVNSTGHGIVVQLSRRIVA